MIHNCLLTPEKIVYRYPFHSVETTFGSFPVLNVSNGGWQGGSSTLIWDKKEIEATCPYILWETLAVSKTTFTDMEHLDTAPRLPTGDRVEIVYHFRSDLKGLVFSTHNGQVYNVSNLLHNDDLACVEDNGETFLTKGELLLQYQSNDDVRKDHQLLYADVSHVPSNPGMINTHPGYNTTRIHLSHPFLGLNINTLRALLQHRGMPTRGISGGFSIPTRHNRRNKRQTPQEDINLERLDYIQDELSTAIANISMSLCETQQKVFDLNVQRLDVDPSDTLSIFMKRRIKVERKGDIFALLQCLEIPTDKITLIPSLRTNYPPLLTIYDRKGVHISEDLCFSRPMGQFDHMGQTVTAQLVSPNEVDVIPFFTEKCRHEKYKKGRNSDRQETGFFRLGNRTHIYMNHKYKGSILSSDIGDFK